jgi:hypothetical protein
VTVGVTFLVFEVSFFTVILPVDLSKVMLGFTVIVVSGVVAVPVAKVLVASVE